MQTVHFCFKEARKNVVSFLIWSQFSVDSVLLWRSWITNLVYLICIKQKKIVLWSSN